jgi:HD-GYP domain-containing protein (c-di-GMP phosphodiesterase class II)
MLAQQARTDPVTGLPHHGSFQIALAWALAEARQHDEAVALALLDLDGFRNYNERLGVQAGDACLERVGRMLQGLVDDPALAAPPPSAGAPLPPLASAYRVGGDEFALLLRGTLAGEDAAVALAQRAVRAIAGLFGDDPLARITASAGLASYPADAASRSALVALADAALYLVRQTGGNRLGRADALARETLVLRSNLEKLVQTSLAGAGSESIVEYLVAEAAALQQSPHHSSLADRLTTEALGALAAAIDAKDDYTRGHSERVAAIAGEIARHLGCGSQEVQRIVTAARMHDIGKIGVPDDLLHKGHDLTKEERAQVARHPEVGAAILMPIHTLRDVVPIVRHHHERVDGQGYPAGLRDAEIPFGARVLAVADALDAMITDRPYRRGMAIEAALAELQRHVGTHFWQPVVDAVIALYGPGGAGLAVRNVPRLDMTPAPGAPARRQDNLPAELLTPMLESKAVTASSHPG